MWDQETNIEEVKSQVQEQRVREKQASDTLTSVSEALSSIDTDLDVDIENAKLEEVKAASDKLNDNIAQLIFALDETTSGIDQNFGQMKQKSGMEKFVGIFSKSKSDEMRSTRISNSDISSNLNDLIVQSEGIIAILQDQETFLTEELNIGNVNLEKTIKARQETVDALEEVKRKMNDLDPVMMDLESRIDNETNPAERTKLEDELAGHGKTMQDLKNDEAKLLAKSQTLESYVEQNKVHIKSLGEQKTAQQVLIEKLKTDTSQRVVLYKQYEVSLKTAQQQETAHQLNEIGGQVDKSAMLGMAQMGAASSNRLAGMLEGHLDDMQDKAKISKRQADANERFRRRFKTALDRHDTANYS